jgi:hypothetical protein
VHINLPSSVCVCVCIRARVHCWAWWCLCVIVRVFVVVDVIQVIDVFVARFSSLSPPVTHIAGYDARYTLAHTTHTHTHTHARARASTQYLFIVCDIYSVGQCVCVLVYFSKNFSLCVPRGMRSNNLII